MVFMMVVSMCVGVCGYVFVYVCEDDIVNARRCTRSTRVKP